MLVDQAAIEMQDKTRADLDRAIAQYLASGKTITVIDPGITLPMTPEQKIMQQGCENYAKRRAPKKATHRKHSGEDLASFARRVIDEGIV